MNISEYLKEDFICMELTSVTKKEVITELSEIITRSKKITDKEKYLEEVFEREELCTTGIGHEIAMPHARTNSVNSFVIAIGRSNQGIDFNSLDGKAVKLVFLMGTPKNEELQKYLHILAYLNRILQKETIRSKLINANTAREIINIFKAAEL